MDEGGFEAVSVAAWLAELASSSATPGGGAAAAASGACGAALIAMTGRLTLGRKGFEPVQGEVEDLVSRADEGRVRFLELAGEDAAGFDDVMAAFKMPKGTDAEKASRSAAIQAAYARAAEAPLLIARLAVGLLADAEGVARVGNPSAVSDACSAAAMLAAASIAAAANVRINASALHDQAVAEDLVKECDSLESAADDGLRRTREIFAERIRT